MSWGRVDDTMPEHRKWAALETRFGARVWADAMATWLCVLCHANRNESDGVVATAQLVRLTPLGRAAIKAADAMVAVGLMAVEGDGYRIHDFTDYNPSRADREEKRRGDTIRQRRHRVTNGVTNAPVTTESRCDGAVSHADVTPSVTPLPARPDPTHPEERALALVRGDTAAGVPFRDFIRNGVIKGYEHLTLPPPRETRDLTWRGWHELEHWTVSKAGLLGWDQRETARHLIRCFLRSAAARKKGHPIKFLVENANEYWRDELPAEVA